MLGSNLDDKLILTRREGLLDQLRSEPSGRLWCLAHTTLVDEIFRSIAEELAEQFPNLPPLSFVATGGYGRQELAPYSDVDFILIPKDEPGPEMDAALRTLYKRFENTVRGPLGLKFDYVFHLPVDAGTLDHKTMTAALDGRLVGGDPEPWELFAHHLKESFPAGEFVNAKLKERQGQVTPETATPYLVEPDLKLGYGGLRSYHLSQWIGTTLGHRPRLPHEAYETVLQWRNLLQLVAGKVQNVLTRAKQAEIADLLGRDMFEAMAELLAAMRSLALTEESAIRHIQDSRFLLCRDILAINGSVRTRGLPEISDAAFGIGLASTLGLEVEPMPLATMPDLEWQVLCRALAFGSQAVRLWDRCSLLEQLLPELTNCRTLLPRDSTHLYSVFEHSIRTLECLETSLESGGFCQELATAVESPVALSLACLLHDVGKADLSRPHSETGAELAQQILLRWQADQRTTEDVVWLVAHHLDLAHLIRTRDPHDPKTIQEFATLVGTRDRLAMLALLTRADILAVHPSLWTNLQESLLREVVARTMAQLDGEGVKALDPALRRQQVLKGIQSTVLDPAEVEAFLASLPAHYLLTATPEQVKEHLIFAQSVSTEGIRVEFFNDLEQCVTEVTVCAPDSPGLLSTILGVIYAQDLSLVALRAATATQPYPVAIDIFTVSYLGRSVPEGLQVQLERDLQRVLGRKIELDIYMASKGRDPMANQRLLQIKVQAQNPAIVEVRSPESKGMAYRIARKIAGQNWVIQTARLGKWADSTVAAFYIQKADGSAPSEEEVLQALLPPGIVGSGV